MRSTEYACRPFGPDAKLLVLPFTSPQERREKTLLLAELLRQRSGLGTVVVGAGSLLLLHEAADLDPSTCAALLAGAQPRPKGNLHELPCIYDGPDLKGLAGLMSRQVSDLVRLHSAPTYDVELTGFLPGFSYLQGLDPDLRVLRRPSPRPRVAQGSVGITGEFTGVYPFDSPGGWQLLGRVPSFQALEVDSVEPVRLRPGDRVRFLPAEARAWPVAHVRMGQTQSGEIPRYLLVEQVGLGATIQDLGRGAALAMGFPPSGPMASELLMMSNRVLGNPEGAACVELLSGGMTVRAVGEHWISVDGGQPKKVRDGESFVCPESAEGVSYLATAGGFSVPLVLGARATLAAARLGGHMGRALRISDRIPTRALGGESPSIQAGSGAMDPSQSESEKDASIRLFPGPALHLFPERAWETLLESTWQVSRLRDRVGTRLSGPPLPVPATDGLPVPMRRGAIQVANDGTPMVLGPDHPITGGYPVIALVHPEDLSLFGRRRVGAALRFRAAGS